MHNSTELFQFILHKYVVLKRRMVNFIINIYFNKNGSFLTYFAHTLIIIVVYFFEIQHKISCIQLFREHDVCRHHEEPIEVLLKLFKMVNVGQKYE